MILSLIRTQPVDVRQKLVAGLATMTLVIGPEMGVFFGLPVLLVLPFLMTRVMVFELTVPLSARQVFAARMITSLTLMIVPVALWAIAWLVRDPASFSLRTIVASAGGAALLAVMPLAWQPHSAVPPRPGHLALLVALIASTAALLGYFAPVAVSAMVLLLAFGAIVLRTLNALPPAYVVDPEVTVSFPHTAIAAMPLAHHGKPRRELPFFLWFVRQHFSPMTAALVLLLLVVGVAGSPLFLMITYIALIASTVRGRVLFSHIVPLSMRQRFAALVVAAVVLPLSLMLTGSLVREAVFPHNSLHHDSPDASADDYDRDESASRIPFEFWEAAETNVVPSIVAPWGETAIPWSVSFFGRTWYNPYSVVAASSERFRDWQFSRATTVAYGKPIPREQYDDDRHAIPPLVTRSASMMLLKGAVATIVTLLLLVSLESSRVRALNKNRVFRSVQTVAFLLALAVLIGPDLYYGQYSMDILSSLVSRALLHFVQGLSDPLPVAALIAVVSVAITWKFAEWVYSKTEIDKQDFLLNAAAKR